MSKPAVCANLNGSNGAVNHEFYFDLDRIIC